MLSLTKRSKIIPIQSFLGGGIDAELQLKLKVLRAATLAKVFAFIITSIIEFRCIPFMIVYLRQYTFIKMSMKHNLMIGK